jgi:hypothetical protein
MRLILVVIFLWTLSPGFAWAAKRTSMGCSMRFFRGDKSTEVKANAGRYGLIVVDAHPFKQRASKICEWLVKPPARNADCHSIYGRLLGNRLTLLPEFENDYRGHVFGYAKVNFADKTTGYFYSSELRSDQWHSRMSIYESKLPEPHFHLVGPLMSKLPEFFSALDYLEDGSFDPERSLVVSGKLKGTGDEFVVDSLAVRMTIHRHSKHSIRPQQFVLAKGELTKVRRGYRVTTASGQGFNVTVIHASSAVLPSDPIDLEPLVHKQVIIQGVVGPTGIFEVHAGEHTFVRQAENP